MTSKEALKELIEDANELNCSWDCSWELDRLNQLKKDLELLDVLKKLKPFIKVYQYIEFDNWVLEIGKLKISLDEKEAKILKEWLDEK